MSIDMPSLAGGGGLVLSDIEEVVARHGERPAIIDRGEITTYDQLWSWAHAIARGLEARGVCQGALVGLSLDRSAAYVAALLGTWLAGAAFVPLPPEIPELRRQRIIDEAKPAWVLAEDEVVRARSRQPSTLAGRRPTVEDLAYILYTSGSSGAPKGVMIRHRGIAGLLRAQSRAFGLGPRSRSLFVLSPAFDASISDIGTALVVGAALVIASRDELRGPAGIMGVLTRESITNVDLPPALLPHLDPLGLPASLETIVIGGEVCPPAVVRRFAEVVRVVNVYGPTEATVCASLVRCDPSTWDRPLLGSPIPGMFFRVLDDEGHEIRMEGEDGEGREGELYIGGDGLAAGYLARPELTAERFILREGERLYRSGDRVLVLADGTLEFRGRVDRQRKIGGVRVELDEIEAVLLGHPEVMAAAVFDGPRGSLVAALVSASQAQPPTVTELRAYLGRALPCAAVPGRIVLRSSLPRTSSGKVDRRQLARTLSADDGESSGLASVLGDADGERRDREHEVELDLEVVLAAIWRQILATPDVRTDDRFCDLGGTSLRALEVVAAAEPYGIVLSAARLLDNPSLAEVARAARGDQRFDVCSAADLRADVGRCASRLRELYGLDEVCQPQAASMMSPTGDRLDCEATLLITGATGFLGRHLLCLLAQGHRGRLLALVRATDPRRARQRLQEALRGSARALGLEVDPRAADERCEVVVGDLARPRLALDHDTWTALTHDVDAIVHCAARVNLAAGYQQLRATNLEGTATILELALRGRPKLIHAISTLSVFVAARPHVPEPAESDPLAGTEAVIGGYAQSKWAAEVLLRDVAQGRAALVCHRLGLVTGDTRHGVGPPRDQLALFMRGLVELDAVPEGYEALRVDISPVDAVARALHRLILAGPPVDVARPATYHLASRRGVTGERLVAAMRRTGASIGKVSRAQWRELGRGLGRRSPAAAVAYLALGRCLDTSASRALRAYDLFQATGFDFRSEMADGVLKPRGLCVPPVTSTLLDRYVAAALGERR